MTSSSMPEQEHGRSPPETVTTASDEPQAQLPGLGDPTAGRSEATMVTGGASDEEEIIGAEGPLDDCVLEASPWGVLLAPTPLSSMKQDEEASAPPPPTPLLEKKKKKKMPAAAKRAPKQCLQCGATQTPQWRIQPMGQGTICNACRIRLRPAEALREQVHVHVHLPPPATSPTTVISESPEDGWISDAWMEFDAFLLKGTSSPSPRREKSPSPTPTTTESAPAPAPAPSPEEKKKQKRKRNPWHPRKSSKRCDHCKSACTPQWRTGPKGPSMLCNACGMRYRQGRLLQEYRPAASPNFKPSEHACKHSEVLQLRQKKHGGKEQHQPPQPEAMQPRAGDELLMGEPISQNQLLLDAIDGSPETNIVYGVGGGDLQSGDPSSLDDEFLFGGPAAPPLIDDDEEDEDEDMVD